MHLSNNYYVQTEVKKHYREVMADPQKFEIRGWLTKGIDKERMQKIKQEKEGEMEISRSEHLAWCKKRALEYVNRGDLESAFASMGSDLGKHPETRNHSGIQLGMMLMMAGQLGTEVAMRKFIEGFN